MRKSSPSQLSLFSVSLREYVTFIACVFVSLIFIFSNSNPQVEAIRAMVVGLSAYLVESSTADQAAENAEVQRLRQRATELMLENSKLREAALQYRQLQTMLNFKERSKFDLVAARVIAIQKDKFVRSVVLDAGTADGVRKNMPVVVPEGLCGKIIRADDNSSVAQLLVDHSFRVAGRIERTRVDGIVSYEGGDYCLLKEVPRNANVQAGDVVITSGFSEIFPPNIRIGVVKEAKEDLRSMFKTIILAPAVDFSRIENVFVMTSLHPDST